jgi:hypothetical protein
MNTHDQQRAQKMSNDQIVHIRLLSILDNIKFPDYAFQQIIHWAINAKSMNYSFCPKFTTRTTVLQDITQHLQMEYNAPIFTQLQLNHIQKPISIVSFVFEHQLCSLLNDPTLMQPENLCINEVTLHSNENKTACHGFSHTNPTTKQSMTNTLW